MKHRRALTLMLSVSMLMSSVVPTYAQTEETNIKTTQEAEETVVDSTEPIETESLEMEETIKVEETEPEAEGETEMETLEVRDIQWVFDELEAGNTQKITVMMNRTEGITGAVLKGNAEDKGVHVQFEAAKITDTEVIFEIQHSDADWYTFQTLDLQLKDEVMTIDLEAYDKPEYVVTDLYKGESAGESVSFFSLRRNANRFTGVNGNDDVFVIVLDPGHDPVCNTRGYVNGVWETEMNWKIAVAMKETLEGYSNVEVYINREWNECPEVTDGIEDLEARVTRAANLKADLFVSLHNNALGSGALQTRARGAEVFVTRYPGYSAEATGLAEAVLANLEEMGLPSQGVKTRYYGDDAKDTYDDGTGWDYYAVNRHSTLKGIPSLLIEHAYVDNELDLMILRDEAKLIEMGQRDAQAIIDYYELEVDNGDDAETEENETEDSESDDVDNDSELSGSVRFDQTADEWLNVAVSNVSAAFDIKDVYFKIWSKEADESSAKEYHATFDNAVWSTSVDVKQESMTAGAYKAAVYYDDENGTSHLVKIVDFSVSLSKDLVGAFSAKQASEQTVRMPV